MIEEEKAIRVQIQGLENVISDEYAYIKGLQSVLKDCNNFKALDNVAHAEIALNNIQQAIEDIKGYFNKYLHYMKDRQAFITED